jgi:hypothetical protein
MGTIKRTFANNVLTDGKIDATDLSGTIPASNIADTTVSAVTALPSALGDAIESVATDPVSPSEGQLWYNTTIGVLKGYRSIGGAFASGGNLNTARAVTGGGGTTNAGLAVGGGVNGSTATEEYDGSAWTSGGALNLKRVNVGTVGSQTANLAFGGNPDGVPTNATEEYDGSAWTSGGNMANSKRNRAGGIGTQTAGLAAGGSPDTTATEEYDGSAWASGGALGAAQYAGAGAGIQTAGLLMGGGDPVSYFTSEEYNGTSWTAGNNLNLTLATSGGCGTQTAALGLGTGPSSNQVESYDGTTFTTLPATMSISRGSVAAGIQGSPASTFVAGGNTPTGITAATEEYTDPTFAIQKITTS